MERSILPFFSFQSGRYAVRHAHWHDIDIAVYYNPKHTYNVDSMARGAQRALDYYTEHFGPYPYDGVRIIEFPLYKSYARSLPDLTLISESLGFINDLRGPGTVDHVFYVTAHELAHQWWGDQVIAADVQGNSMVTESLAEYSALMVLQREFGKEKVRHVLRYDLDQYLRGRSEEMTGETPMETSEGQVYIDYRKGSLALYRLRGEIGETALNHALRQFADAYRFKSRPYPTTRDLMACLRSVTPPEKQWLLTDLFQSIVLYDDRVLQADATQRTAGRWDVTLKLYLAKLESDSKGKETPRAYDEPVDIALYGPAQGKGAGPELLRLRRMLPAGDSTLTLTVDTRPTEVAIDPDQWLIDRNPTDLRKRIIEAPARSAVTGD
jgi:aminopeptidase N